MIDAFQPRVSFSVLESGGDCKAELKFLKIYIVLVAL